MFGTSVPKTPIDEDSDALLGKHDIRSDPSGRQRDRVVDAITEASAVQ